MTFSIITPVYGDTWKSLEYYFLCLANQTYKDFETIISFDGQNDRGEIEVKKMMDRYPQLHIKYLTTGQHSGACYARNAGVNWATGKYYAFPGGDCYLEPTAIEDWVKIFEKYPKINRVWGKYRTYENGIELIVGLMPTFKGKPWYPSEKYSNFIDGTFPVRKSAFTKWDVKCKSLNDWEWAVQQLNKTNFRGDDFYFVNKVFFEAEPPQKGGLSDDSMSNFLERSGYIKKKHHLPSNPTVVGGVRHYDEAIKLSLKLKADYIPMPSYRPFNYTAVVSYGFDSSSDVAVLTSLNVFARPGDYEKIIYWPNEDIEEFNRYPYRKNIIDKFKRDKIKHYAKIPIMGLEVKEWK